MSYQMGNIDRFSSITSDPLRGFRFYAEFKPATGYVVPGAQKTFDSRILTDSGKTGTSAGYSNGFVGGFSQIAGLQLNIQDIQYREGGFNVTYHHVPGMVTYTPVTFQRGVLYGNDQVMTWVKGLASVTAGSGLNPNSTNAAPAGNFRVDVDIYIADHPNTSESLLPRMRWTLRNAYLTNLTYTDLNAFDNGILYETMTLVHEGLSMTFVDGKSHYIKKPAAGPSKATGSTNNTVQA